MSVRKGVEPAQSRDRDVRAIKPLSKHVRCRWWHQRSDALKEAGRLRTRNESMAFYKVGNERPRCLLDTETVLRSEVTGGCDIRG
jgi:hypothetical protein